MYLLVICLVVAGFFTPVMLIVLLPQVWVMLLGVDRRDAFSTCGRRPTCS